MKAIDPRDTLQSSPMKPWQILVVAITIGLNALDGFDVLAISFASPGIAEEWGVDLSSLGIVLSMELIGMGLGSFLLGDAADRFGRRPTILACLLVMALGMYMATVTNGIWTLSFWRVFTGIGIGGMLSAINAMAAEFSNTRRRHLCISLMAIGYPIGGVVGGFIAARLLETYDWRSVFYLGTVLTVFFIPVVYFMVPESVHWLTRKQPTNALERINYTLRRLGYNACTSLPEITESARKKSSLDIFSPRMLAITLIIAMAYFLHIMTFYFIIKWVPKLVTDMGFASSSAGDVLVLANVGGALGGVVFGLLTLRFALKHVSVAVILLAGVFVAVFGQTPADLAYVSFFAALAGFFGNAGIVGLYAIAAQAFPTHARAFGTGFMIGFGRGGSVLSPILAGFLLDWGLGLPFTAIVMGIGSLLAGTVLLFLKLHPEPPLTGQSDDDGEEPKEAAAGKGDSMNPSLA